MAVVKKKVLVALKNLKKEVAIVKKKELTQKKKGGGGCHTKAVGGGRKLNGYFQAMLQAKKNNAKSFTYKNSVYKQQKAAKGGLVVYKKA